MIRYISTRGGGTPQSFNDVLMAGMAPDGGLYVPDQWPAFDAAMMSRMAGLSYGAVAQQVISPFVGDDIPADALQDMIAQTYESDIFDHTAVAPLVQLGPQAWLMELYRGPTLSFKDYALQLLGRLFDYVLAQRGQRMTILGATSGDTGSAAIAACAGRENIDIFILHPKGRTSDIQRRQMTTAGAQNVHNIAVEGTFDDCQALVKAAFADEGLRTEMRLSAVNSINWARIMAQTVYYFTAALALGAPGRAVSFAVPTGNFGNVYAAYAARQMGLPIHSLTVATNSNDILTRFFETGTMAVEGVAATISPSMDIQVSSNFERYLFDLVGRNAGTVRDLMARFAGKKKFTVDAALQAQAQAAFNAQRGTDDATRAMMQMCYQETGILIDPHTAVGLHAATVAMQRDPAVPMVVLACAHPAKFPEAVQEAAGTAPPVPARLAAVMKKAEHLMVLPNDLGRLAGYMRQNIQK